MHSLTKNSATQLKQDSAQESLALALNLIRQEPAEEQEATAMALVLSDDARYIIRNSFLRSTMLALYEYDEFDSCPDIKARHFKQWRTGSGTVSHPPFNPASLPQPHTNVPHICRSWQHC